MRSISLVFCLLLFAEASAQDRSELMKQAVAEFYQSVVQPPKLETERDRFSLLDNRSVRIELGLGVKEWLEIQGIRRKAVAEVQSLTGRHLKPFDLVIAEEVIRQREADEISRILTDIQMDRLDQLVHYVEIAYITLPKALAEGKLGREVGVYENQMTQIISKGEEIIEESVARISNIQATTHQEILKLLPPESKDKATGVLGSYFEIGSWAVAGRDYREDQKEESTQKAGETGVSADTLPSGIQATPSMLLSLLVHSEVQQELDLTPDQVDGINEAKSRKKGGDDTSELLSELLLPNQAQRVQQLFHYVELKQSGYAEAITAGKIGKALGVPSQSAPTLRPRIHDLETKRDQQCRSIMEKTHERILDLLSSEQRRKAEQLLGPYFCYVDGIIAVWKDMRDLYLRSKTAPD
jgi:hypothetical protein